MRAMWKGALSFGLVSVPVKLYAATEDHDVRFHQVHEADGGRIKMKRTCSVDGEQVEYKDLAKAYEAPDGRVVVMTDEDFAGLPVPGLRDIDIIEFVPADQVDPVLFDRAYYLEPDGVSVKPYVLLREALQSTDRIAIAKVVLRSKQQLAALRVRGNVMMLQTMLWPDEVREADFAALETEIDARPQELQMASSLIENLSADFDPAEFVDEYREALLNLVEAKLSDGTGVQDAVALTSRDDQGSAVVVDLMAALKESVERTQGARLKAAPPVQTAAPKQAAVRKSTAPKAAPTKRVSRGKAATSKTSAAKTSAARDAAKSDADIEKKPSRRRSA